MQTSFSRCAGAVCLLFVATAARGQTPDPLRFIPATADAVFRIENPRKLIEAITRHEVYKGLYNLDAARTYLDTLPVRTFYDLVAYVERELGAPWPELIDKLAGGGIAVGVKYGEGNPPALLVIQGTDEAATKRFVEKALAVADQELALQEGAQKLERTAYKGIDVIKVGKDVHLARVGSALLAGNSGKVLKAALDLVDDKQGSAKSLAGVESLQQARKLLPPDPLVWGWVNLVPVKQQEQAKKLFAQPRNDFVMTFLFADLLDVGRLADCFADVRQQTPDGFTTTIRAPAGLDGRGADTVLHVPEDPKVPGTKPFLEPKNVVFSYSFYLDLNALWTKRSQIMNAEQAKSFEEGEKQASRFLPGASLSKLFAQSGPHWRFVATNQGKELHYKIEPGTRSGDFAVVVSMREPGFAKSVESMIRGGAIIAGFQVGGLKMFEEEIDGVKVFGYRFKEGGKFPADVDNIRFNFVPTFAAVNDQYIFASNRELCRELIGLIRKESGTKPQSQNLQLRVYAKGTADSLTLTPDQLITSTILSQGVGEVEARKQAEALVKYLESLGTVTVETDHTDKTFRFDVKWQMKK